MNRKHLSVLALAGFASVALLGGCFLKKDKDAKLVNLSISGVPTSYMPGATIEWDKFTVTATYDNKKTETFNKIEFDVDAAAKSETQLVVFTSGLHAKGVLTEEDKGEYTISGALPSDMSKKYEIGKMFVGEITSELYDLMQFAVPEVISAYKTGVEKAASTGKTGEDGLMDATQPFTVGTMNTFKIAPQVMFISKTDDEDIQTGNNFRKDITVKQVVNGSEQDAAAADFTVVEEGIKFADSAAGKSFKVTVKPADFPKTLSQKEAVCDFTIKVEKGFNVYNAKQLGVLNLTHYTRADFDKENISDIVEHIGNERRNSADPVFATIEGSQVSYHTISYTEVWTKFLKDTGTFTDAELVAYQDVPAIFFQSSNIELTSADIPSEYFIYPGELATDELVGCLRDGARIYVPIVHEHSVEINGNYCNLKVSLPLCKNNTEGAGSNQAFTPYVDGYTGLVFAGHATLIEFCGICQDGKRYYRTNQVDVENGNRAIVRNLNSTGNAGKPSGSAVDDLDKKNTITALIFAQTKYVGCLFENNNIKEYQIAFATEQMVGQGNPDLETPIPQKDYAFIKQCKVYDCSNCGIFNYENGGVSVEKSILKRFGGSAIINAGNTDFFYGANTKVDSETVMENSIAGNEIYFSALKADSYVTQIKGLEAIFQVRAAHRLVKNGKFNLMAMTMDGNDYVFSDNGPYYGSFAIGDNGYDVGEICANPSNLSKFGAGKIIMFTEVEEQFEFDMINQPAYFERDGVALDPVVEGRKLHMLVPVQNGGGFTILSLTFNLYL